MCIDRKKLRATLAEATPQRNADALADLVDICGEFARELRLELPDLISAVTGSYAEAHDLKITHFSCEEDEPPAGADPITGRRADYSTIVAMKSKWTGN